VILWLLSTGARVSEALSANWSDIDRDREIWGIHAANSKSKKRRSVALNEAALKVLDELQGLPNYNPEGRLFIGKQTNRTRQPEFDPALDQRSSAGR
jgi:integrase